MVPVKLHLRNFMSYRGTNGAIDFSGIHLACLAGDNGHGKSAILDAMTWALWGRARAKRDDDLITRGESEMEVSFEFDLGPDRYRVIRKRSNKGRGSSVLELQVRRNGLFVPLSEPAIRETQQKITELLRLEYDTFVNSAFLLQGRADEFTTKRPAERKQILSDILGLTIYDTYSERARERQREAELERQAIERELEEIKRWIERIPELEQDVITCEARALAAAERLRAEEAILRELREQKRELDLKAEQLAAAERRVSEAAQQVLTLERRIAERQANLRRFDDLLARAETIEANYARLLEVRQELEHWNQGARELLTLQGEQAEVQRALDAARAAIESDLKVAERDLDELRKRAARREELQAAWAKARAELAHLETLQTEQERQQQERQGAREELAAREQENAHLMDAMKALRRRIALLESDEAAVCPVCRQALAAEHRDRVLEEMQAEGTELGDKYRRNQGRMSALSETIARLDQMLSEASSRLNRLGTSQGQAARAEQALAEAQQAAASVPEAEQRGALLRVRLDSRDYAAEIQGRLAELEQAAHTLGYDAAAHQLAQQLARESQPAETEYNELLKARDGRDNEQAVLEAFQQQLALWQSRREEGLVECAALRQALAGRTDLVRRAEEQGRVVTEAQKEATEADRREGATRQLLEFAEQQSAKQAKQLRELEYWTEERTIFGQLHFAFGKRGIQAMLIEAAIPEIEDEANSLLGRMTDGRMNVRIETQREGKTTDAPIETLDIVIADEQGERPYELFSGGEAFRINFALRIALSKLLANRAGARLQTLVIDEGFGTQDAQGRERIVEAITAVQQDFERILVITHLDELKDAFPVRIDVTKGPGGSTVSIN